MNSATFSRGQVRIAAAAAGLAAALVLAGCGSDDGAGDDGAGDDDSSPETSAEPTESTDTGGGSGGSTAEAEGLEGSWLTTKDGKAVALVITGRKAALFSTGGSPCGGTAGETAGMQMIALKCTDGNKDRAEGMVDSVNSTTLKVTWKDFGEETYRKSEDGKLPTGLPTAGLGS